MRSALILAADSFFGLIGAAAGLFYRLAGWRSICSIGRAYGDIAYLLDSKKRRITAGEIKLLFGRGDRETREIAKGSFENYYERQLATVFFGSLDKKTVDRIVEAEGLENLDHALAAGRGVILLLSHFGFFLLPLPYLGFSGYTVNQVTGRQLHSSLIAERFLAWRKKEADRLPVKFIQVGKFLRPLYQALGKNEIIAVAFDGRDGANWVDVDLLGKKARLSTGPFEIARRTGAAIVPTFIVREGGGRHRLVLEPPFDLSPESDLTRAVREDTAAFARIFEKYIERYPCHFGMVLYKMRLMKDAGTHEPFITGTK